MTPSHYADLPTEAQVDVIEAVAARAAPQFGLLPDSLELVLHEYNTTFSVLDDSGAKFALRVNTNSVSTPEHIVAQQSWLTAMATHPQLRVPVPRPTATGEWFVQLPCPAFGDDLRVTVASWLSGVEHDGFTVETAAELGRCMARLHQQARGWSLPEGAALPIVDEPLFGDPDRLTSALAADFSADDQGLVAEAMRRCQHGFTAVIGSDEPLAIHADLHSGNLIWDTSLAQPLGLFDVDDMAIATPALDLAVTTFYLRHDTDEARANEAALRAGYAEIAPLPQMVAGQIVAGQIVAGQIDAGQIDAGQIDAAAFEATVASRALLLANFLLESGTAEHRAEARPYLEKTLHRLRHWIDTGRFVLLGDSGQAG